MCSLSSSFVCNASVLWQNDFHGIVAQYINFSATEFVEIPSSREGAQTRWSGFDLAALYSKRWVVVIQMSWNNTTCVIINHWNHVYAFDLYKSRWLLMILNSQNAHAITVTKTNLLGEQRSARVSSTDFPNTVRNVYFWHDGTLCDVCCISISIYWTNQLVALCHIG